MILAATVAVVVATLAPSVVANPLPEGVHIDGDTVERVDPETDERQWRVVHPSIWRTPDREKQEFEIRAVSFDGRIYYAVRTWLLRLDPETGTIENRVLFPAEIEGLETSDDSLRLTLGLDPEFGPEGAELSVRFEPGTPPPRHVWNWVGQLSVWKDASYLKSGIFAEEYDMSEEERGEALTRLRRRRDQEPANPFYDYFIGWLHDDADHPEKAEAAFERAVERDGAHWTALLQLTAFFDKIERHDFADRAFAQATERIESDPRIRVRRWRSFVSYVILLGWSKEVVDEAVRNERVEQVDRILGRTAQTFPNLDYTGFAWTRLAAWLEERGHPELAETWRERARRASDSPWPENRRMAKTVDLTVALLVGFGLGLPLACFVIGLRRARPSENRGWLPKPTRGELLGLAVAALMPVALLWVQKTRTQTITTVAEIPEELLSDAWSSPNALPWLNALEPSAPRDALIEDVKGMRDAMRAGEFDRVEPPDHERVTAAIRADSRARAWDAIAGYGTFETLKDVDFEYRPVYGMVLLAGMVLAFVAGGALAFFLPAIVPVGRYLVPGGARSAAFLTPFVVAIALASLGAFAFGFDTILRRISAPAIGEQFGLQSVVRDAGVVEPPTVRRWIGLAAALVIHVATLWWDWTRD